MKQPDITSIKQITYDSGQIMKRHAHSFLDVEFKNDDPGDLVTKFDKEIERFITNSILTLFPNHSILSEEFSPNTSSPLEKEHIWIIDPIDGTNNFVFGRNLSAVSIGYAQKGVLKLGCVYNPFTEELWIAEQGNGSYCNDTKIVIPNRSKNHLCNIGTDNGHAKNMEHHVSMLLKIKPNPLVHMIGSAAIGLCWIASGKTDVYFHMGLKPWDIAAGMLIIQEAGGIVLQPSSEPATFMSSSIFAGKDTFVNDIIAQTQ